MNKDDPVVIAAALCRNFEGLYLKPYLCPANVPTIGYGTTRYEDGTKVSLTDSQITKERAEELLQWELKQVCLPQVKRLCPDIESLGTGITAALIDFTYNLGSGNLASSTLRKKVNAGDIEGTKEQLMRWTKAGGKELSGLVRRRKAEANLF